MIGLGGVVRLKAGDEFEHFFGVFSIEWSGGVVDEDEAGKVGSAELVDIRDEFVDRHGPADQDDGLELEAVDDGFDVSGSRGGVKAFAIASGAALAARVHGDDAVVGFEVVELVVPDPGGHGPARDEEDGGGFASGCAGGFGFGGVGDSAGGEFRAGDVVDFNFVGSGDVSFVAGEVFRCRCLRAKRR